MVIFHLEAPLTVRLGAIGALCCAIAETAFRFSWSIAPDGPEPTLWSSVIRPLISLLVGVGLAWGIAQLNGLFYWSWFGLSMIVFAIVLVVPLVRLFSASPKIGAISVGPPFFILGLLWLVTSVLLLSPSSIRAFWRHGHLKFGRDVG